MLHSRTAPRWVFDEGERRQSVAGVFPCEASLSGDVVNELGLSWLSARRVTTPLPSGRDRLLVSRPERSSAVFIPYGPLSATGSTCSSSTTGWKVTNPYYWEMVQQYNRTGPTCGPGCTHLLVWALTRSASHINKLTDIESQSSFGNPVQRKKTCSEREVSSSAAWRQEAGRKAIISTSIMPPGPRRQFSLQFRLLCMGNTCAIVTGTHGGHLVWFWTGMILWPRKALWHWGAALNSLDIFGPLYSGHLTAGWAGLMLGDMFSTRLIRKANWLHHAVSCFAGNDAPAVCLSGARLEGHRTLDGDTRAGAACGAVDRRRSAVRGALLVESSILTVDRKDLFFFTTDKITRWEWSV
ncbi:hypothetical protein BaRGS_00013202 [Batillaria attramentaria]|uniref:Uncharacterized protein n=1 Tax=Batillaria attramentaria TaxID=370345 RepID=A0ABD0L8R9_9CAEN